MGSPARQKRLGLSFFAPILSGFVGLRGCHFVKIGFKWVCSFCQNCQKFESSGFVFR
nr:MAG TPA: hypothetical protein [Caudoviricetes sp.]